MGWGVFLRRDNWNRTYVDREKVTGARVTSSVSKILQGFLTWGPRPPKGQKIRRQWIP